MFVQRLLRSSWMILALGTAACATVPGTGPAARAAEIEQNTVELRAQNAGYVRRIEELQNRIFILEDQIDSRRLAVAPVNVPVPSKRIGVAMREVAPVAEASAGDEDSTVEYAGEAAQAPRRSRIRPVLRLAGSGRALTVAPVEASAPNDKLAQLEPLRLYHQGLDALRAGHQAVAMATFRRFLTRYPHHDYADNAQYWVGQCYYDLDQFKASVLEFRRVVERYPHGNKVPDAMLKIGYAHLATGDRREARVALESLKRVYPHHALTRLAVDRLAQLQMEMDDRSDQTAVSLEMSRR